jgi:hypothetical protein
MTPSDEAIEAAIDGALDVYDRGDAFWPLPIIDELEKLGVGCIFSWTAGCFRNLLQSREYWAGAAMSADLDRLPVESSIDSLTEMGRKYEEDGVRDTVGSAFIFLIRAKIDLTKGHTIGVRTHAMYTMMKAFDRATSDRDSLKETMYRRFVEVAA